MNKQVHVCSLGSWYAAVQRIMLQVNTFKRSSDAKDGKGLRSRKTDG